MRSKRVLVVLAAGIAVLFGSGLAGAAQVKVQSMPAIVPGGFNGDPSYTGGPHVCGECHQQEFDDWLAHGHSRKLTLAFDLGSAIGDIDAGDRGHTYDARREGFALPTHDKDVYNWDNVLFVVGGSKHWKSRFVGLDGYFLTKGGLNQYNWANGEWVDYHKDEVDKPFDCGTCHTTGYQPDGTTFAAQFPGIVRDFAHINITCEACHGPGAEHAAAPSDTNITIDRSSALCGQCHTRGGDNNVVIASGSFIRHHEQYPEMLKGAHGTTAFEAIGGCNACHDSHVGRYEGIKTMCETCHPAQAAEFDGSAMQLKGVDCIDCHMGRATRSARNAGPYEGDVWTHLFRIDSSADYDMFNRDSEGKATSVADEGALSLEFACFRCHSDADKAAFAAISTNGTAYHTIGK